MSELVETPVVAVDEQVLAGVISALQAVLETDVPDMSTDTKLSDLGLDSTGVLELLMQLEETLGVEFDTDNLRMGHFESVGSLAAFVSAELAG